MGSPNPYNEFRGMPRMAQDSLPKPTGLSPAEKTKIILVLLHTELGTDRFCRLINDSAIEMEVVGIIDSADRAKTMAKTLSAVDTQQKNTRRIQFLCEELACRNGDEAMQEIARHTARIQELREQLYAAYEDQALKTFESILNEAKRRSVAMRTGPSGSLYTILERISQSKTSE